MPASLFRRTEEALSSIDDREPGSTVRMSPARRGLELRHPNEPSARPDDAEACIEVRPAHREGNHLDGSRETPRVHHRHRGKRREGKLLADRVHRRDPLFVDREHPANRGEQVAAPGERGAGDESGARGGTNPRSPSRTGRQGFRKLPGRIVLGDVVRVEASRHHRVVPGLAERRDVIGGQALALLERACREPEPVGEYRVLRVAERGRTEAH